jgi:hypothetical protein
MKYYIIMDDLSCWYLAKSKKDMIDYIKMNYKSWKYDEIENIKDIDIFYIKFNSKKINVDDFFGDIIAIDKKENESIDYDNYSKYWIKDWKLNKKDFLYHNL